MRIILLLFFFIISCQSPNEPLGVKINYEIHYETIDASRGLDVKNGILVVAASTNGYMRYNILNEGTSPTLELANHVPDINPNVGDDAAYDVKISDNFNDMAFILDDVDNIIIEHFEDEGIQTLDACGDSRLYRSIAISDDIPDTTILFTLQKHFDVLPAGFDEFSTSVGIREFYNIFAYDEMNFTETGCDAALNLNIEAMSIFYSNSENLSERDGVLIVAEGGLGVKVYSYNRYKDETFNTLEFLDSFYIQGGEADGLFSIGDYVIGGFNNDRGCYMALLDSDGTISGNITFADGYSINAIDYSDGTLALAAGDDGIIVYDWSETLSVRLKGMIGSSDDDNYVYDIKVEGDIIYVASENGISIYKIEG